MRGLLATVLVLGLFSLIATAGEQPVGKVVLDLWDAAYLEGGRAGYAHTFVEEFDRDEQKVLRTTVELRLKIKRFGDTLELGMDSGDYATPEGKVLAVFMRQALAKNKKVEIAGIVKGGRVHLTRDGTEPQPSAPWDDDTVGFLRQQTILKDRKVKPGDKFTYSSFEPTINLVLKTQIEAKDYEAVLVPGAKQKAKLLRV
jgi:hypothetical protein